MLYRLYRSLIRRIRHQILLRRARRQSWINIQRPDRIGNILFICYGNIYRSPLAEHYFRTRIQDISGFVITSAGFHHKIGRESPGEFCRLVHSMCGINLADHCSVRIDPANLAKADLIVIMDCYNQDLLQEFSPESIHKVVWLGAFSEGPVEIPDPYGQSESMAIYVINRIIDSCEGMLGAITKISEQTILKD